MFRIKSIGLVALFLVQPVWAQDTAPAEVESQETTVQGDVSQDASSLDTVTVWGTSVSSSSVFLGEGDIAQKQADHLSDLLRDQPGVEVGGTHSTNQRINIRAMDDTDLNITLDGAQQSNFMYHHMGNLLINADILKQVDIAVGNNSVAHGGLGGAVRFETKDAADLLKPGQDYGARFSAGYFSNAASFGSLTAYGQLGENGDFMTYGYSMDRDNPEDGDGTENVGNDGTITDLLVKLGYALSPNSRVELGVGQYLDKGKYTYRPDLGPDSNTQIPGSSLPYPTEYQRDTVTLAYELEGAEGSLLRVSAYSNEQDLQRDESIAAKPLVQGIAKNTGINLEAQTHFNSDSANHGLTYGIGSARQQSEHFSNRVKLSEEQGENQFVFVENKIAFTENFSLTPGLRYDRYNSDTINGDNTDDEWSSALAMEYQLDTALNLQASYTELFKGPELSQIFTNAGGVKTPNPDLKPENGSNTELGLRYFQRDTLGADSVAAGVTVFKTKIRNKIAPGGTASMDENIGTAVIDGIETSLKYSINNASLLLSYAQQDSEVAEYSGANEPLDREIGDTFGVNLDYAFSEIDLLLSWNAQFIAKEDNVRSGSDAKSSYKVHNFSAVYTPDAAWEGLSITFGIDNVFDEHYSSHASRTGSFVHPVFGPLVLEDYEPGRNIKLSLAYEF